MSDNPKVWPPRPDVPGGRPKQPAPPSDGGAGPKGPDGAGSRRVAVAGIAVLVVVAFFLLTGGDDDIRTTAPSTAARATSVDSATATPAPPGEPVAPGSVPPNPPSGDEGEQRANSAQACGLFRAVADALPSGDELRARLEEVNDAAGDATQAVRDSARAMLDAVIRDDGDRFLRAGGDLVAACRAAGH